MNYIILILGLICILGGALGYEDAKKSGIKKISSQPTLIRSIGVTIIGLILILYFVNKVFL